MVGLLYYLLGGRYVSTDNAYVGAQKVLITPEVSGKVVRIAVTEGQLLKPGDELFAIDPEPYRLTAQEAGGPAAARAQRLRRPQGQPGEPDAADRAVAPDAWPRRGPTSTARPSCSATASARNPTSTRREWR